MRWESMEENEIGIEDIDDGKEKDQVEIENDIRNDTEEEKYHFSDTYELKASVKYEVNEYYYETDERGRIEYGEGSLRLEAGKRNTDHQLHAGGIDRLALDEGGHIIATRFGGSEKIDNIVAMDAHLNRVEYKNLEDEWACLLKKGFMVEVRVDCKYEDERNRPLEFIINYKVTEIDGRSIHNSIKFRNGRDMREEI